jgi:hypothetical protein
MIRPSEITWRNGLIIPIGVGWLAIARPQQLPGWVLGLGAGLTVAGLAMRLWSAGCLIKNDKLSTGGPYRFLRDPMYFGSMLCVSGLFTAAGNFGMLVAFHIVFHLLVMPRKQHQEGQRLLRRFGMDYANYVVAVSSLVPRFTPYESKEPTEFDFRHALVKNHEFGIWLLVVSVGAVLAAKAAGLTPWLKLPWAIPSWI